MPTVLSDPSPTLYLVLVAAAVVTGAVAARRQDRRSLLRFGAAVGLLLGLYLIDLLIESPREGAVAGVLAMVKAANDRDAAAFVAPVADTLEYKGAGPPGQVTREQLRSASFWGFLTRNRQIAVHAKDFARGDAVEIDPDTIEIGFVGQGRDERTGGVYPLYLRATFARQPDGKVRMTKLASFDYARRANLAASIPYFP